MKKILFFVLFIFVCVISYSQKDSFGIKNNTTEPRSETISKARRILLDKFIGKDFFGVMNEMDFLMALDDEDYIALYPQEIWLLSYWIKDYKTILYSIPASDSGMLRLKSKRIPPQNDYLTTKLIEKSKENKQLLLEDINSAALDKEQKDFLSLILKFLSESVGYAHPVQEELNSLADNFLNSYPASKYADFITKFIRVKYVTSDSGFGYSLYAGKFLFTKNLNTFFTQPTILGLSIEGVKAKWLYQLNITVGFAKTKTDMPVNNNIWIKGSKSTGGHIDFAVGRYLLENKNIGLAPFASVGVFGFSANSNTEKEPEFKEAGIKTTIAGSAGLIADIKLKSKQTQHNFGYNYTNSYGSTQTTAIRLTYGYIANSLKNNFVDFNGSVHKLTLGIAIVSKNKKRVY